MSTPVVVVDLRRSWGLVVLRGALALLFGLFTLAWPGITALALAFVFGFYVLVDSIGLLMDAFRNPDKSNRGMRIFGAALGIIAGLIAILWPGVTAAAIAVLVGAWALITGVAEIAAAIRLRKQIQGELLLGLAGLLSVIFGLMLIVWPAVGAATIAYLIGIFALIYGAVLLFLGMRMRRLARSIAPTT